MSPLGGVGYTNKLKITFFKLKMANQIFRKGIQITLLQCAYTNKS